MSALTSGGVANRQSELGCAAIMVSIVRGGGAACAGGVLEFCSMVLRVVLWLAARWPTQDLPGGAVGPS